MDHKETLLVSRPKKTDVAFDIAWAYPNTYLVGMSGLGYQLIWWLLEQQLDLEVRRVFTDWQEYGWEKADLLGFTLSWELDYANIFDLLKRAGIPLLSSERQTEHPIVFGGGPVLSANPEPYAAFFDVVLLGDAEVSIPAFLDKWREVRDLPSRRAKLEQLATVDGVYVPSLYEVTYHEAGPVEKIEPISEFAPSVVRRQVFTAPDDYIAHSVILTPEGTWGDIFLAEIVRSCPQECRFCLASYLTRPFRSANVDTLMSKIELALPYTKKVGLLGPSVTEHPDFSEIAERLMKLSDVEVQVASIRADTIDPLILKMMVKLGQKSVTIALESGSERLREIMKKNLNETQIYEAMELIAGSGLSGVKLYGIAGLPGETQEDIDETVRLLTSLKKKHKQLRITFGISSFVPKAQTPFQWAGRDRKSGEKIEYIRKRLAKIGIEVRPESHNWSDVQALLSRGDRRMSDVLLSIADSAGNLGAWKRAMRKPPPNNPGNDFYVFRNIPYDDVLPWRHLMDDAKAGMLYRHSATAEKLALTLDPVARA